MGVKVPDQNDFFALPWCSSKWLHGVQGSEELGWEFIPFLWNRGQIIQCNNSVYPEYFHLPQLIHNLGPNSTTQRMYLNHIDVKTWLKLSMCSAESGLSYLFLFKKKPETSVELLQISMGVIGSRAWFFLSPLFFKCNFILLTGPKCSIWEAATESSCYVSALLRSWNQLAAVVTQRWKCLFQGLYFWD